MRALPMALGAALLLMPSAAIAEPLIRVARTPAGVALDWTGGAGLTDVVAIDLAAIRSTAANIELGTVRSIECGSADATTRNGNEDVSTSRVIGYLAGSGGNYGPASTGKPRTIASGDCTSAGPLTQAQFCQRWRQDSLIQCTDPWSGNPAPQGCDAGVVSSVAVQDALRLTNLYRWMAGLAPVSVDPALSAKCQDGALLLRDLGYLTHQPEPGSACYTTTGDAACGSSNISAGYVDLADSVDAYLADYGIPTLGHRRWLLHPPLQKTGFGFVEGAGTYSVQWIIGSGSTVAPPFVAWPSAGWFPSDAPVGRWSFSVKNAGFTSATVRVTRVSDGRPMTVSAVEALPNGYSWPAIAYDVAGVTAGNDYRIVIDGVTGAGQTRYEYVTQWCDCP